MIVCVSVFVILLKLGSQRMSYMINQPVKENLRALSDSNIVPILISGQVGALHFTITQN